jgi:flagellar basal body P-ring formation protein FlgA
MKLIKPVKSDSSPLSRCKQLLLKKWLILLTLPFSLLVNADSDRAIQSLDSIMLAAKNFLEEKQPSADNPNITVTLSPLDNRLRLSQCDTPLQVFFPQRAVNRGNTTVGVKCLGPVSWKIYVPAKIEHFQQVWVAKRNLAAGDLINTADVKQQRMSSMAMRKAPLLELNNILASSPKRLIRAGSVLYKDSICLVCKGDKVNVLAQNNLISIQVQGIALEDATLGETTQIKNAKSKRVFNAEVVGKNQLKVSLAMSR